MHGGAKEVLQYALTGDSQSPGGEQWRDSLPGKAPKLSLNDRDRTELLTGNNLRVPTYFIQDIHGQPRFAFVLIGDAVNGSHSFGLASASEEVLGRLVEMEEEETTYEHGEGEGSESNREVPPASVISTVTACNVRGGDGAGLE